MRRMRSEQRRKAYLAANKAWDRARAASDSAHLRGIPGGEHP